MSANEAEYDGGPGVPFEVSTAGPVSARQRKAVVSMVERVVGAVAEPVAHVRIRAEHHPEHTRHAPVLLRVVVDIRPGPVRAHVDADTFHEAIDAVEHRLRDQLRHRAERRQASHQRRPSAHEGGWRHGDVPGARPPYFPRPVEDRRIVRHKTFAPAASTVEEAVFDLESMGYDFFLFVEERSGDDAMVDRDDDGAYTVHFCDGPVDGMTDETVPDGIVTHPHGAPRMGVEEAQERLDAGHEPRVFFCDSTSGRGRVLYRRYDGHYGLIVPVDDPG